MTRGALIGGLTGLAICGFLVIAAIVAIDGPDTSGTRLPALEPVGETAQASAPPPTHSAKPAIKSTAEPLISRERIVAARKYARSRGGGVSFAVIDSPGGSPRGLNRYAEYPSASVTKAMMLVAVLRRAAGRPVSRSEARLLKPMITESDNDAASVVYRAIGGNGVKSVARAAHMQRFREIGYWAGERLTPADQARFFYRIDSLVPKRHRAYAMSLLASVVEYQRWGIARVARKRGYKIFFKGGWRKNINHQGALLEKDGQRFSLAVMTNQSGLKGQRTEEGIANEILR